jgi:hypothetical protein
VIVVMLCPQLFNGIHQMVPAYMLTLDGLMQQSTVDSQNVNNVQL